MSAERAGGGGWNAWQRRPQHLQRICTSITLSTSNPIWPDPGWNTGVELERQRLTASATAQRSQSVPRQLPTAARTLLQTQEHFLLWPHQQAQRGSRGEGNTPCLLIYLPRTPWRLMGERYTIPDLSRAWRYMAIITCMVLPNIFPMCAWAPRPG
jgi:hypothetical protein